MKRLAVEYPAITQLVIDWDSLCLIADRRARQTKYNPTGKKQVWKLIERSAPILIKEELWFVRVLYHTVEDRLYLDVRRWETKEAEFADNYNPTKDGITLTFEDHFKLFDPVFKLIQKWRKQ